MSHLEARLEKDIEAIREQIAAQADRAGKAVEHAVHALQTGDRSLAYATVLGDHPINRHTRTIDRACHSFVAVHLPSAGLLRLISSIIRVNVELERIGDYAVTIAREAVQMSGPPKGVIAHELERVTSETQAMLRQSVQAFKELNSDVARATMTMADQLEHNLDIVYGELMANTEREEIKDLLATFVVFNQLKRVADQAKNLCEHAIFAATGEEKSAKVYNVLFLDRDNSSLAPMAQAIARNSFPKSGRYSCAALNPVAGLNPEISTFLDQRSIDPTGLSPRPLSDVTNLELAEQHVLVCLEGTRSDYLPGVPFHTSVLEWELAAGSNTEDLYRELAPRIKDLMELLRGEGAN